MKKYKVIEKVTFENVLWDEIDTNTLLNYLYFLSSTGKGFCNEIIPSDVFEKESFNDIAQYIINTPKLLNFLIKNKYIEEVTKFKPITITIKTLEEFKSLYCYVNCEKVDEVQDIIKRHNKKEVIPRFACLFKIWVELEVIRKKII